MCLGCPHRRLDARARISTESEEILMGKLSSTPPAPAKALGYEAKTATDVATHAPATIPANAGGNLAKAVKCAGGYEAEVSARPARKGGY